MFNKLFCLGAMALVQVAIAPSLIRARELTFEDRVNAQRAIEQVYWNHRIWPKENTGPKPPLSAVVPDAAIRAKVEDYLEKSNALSKWWQRPITGEELQAELDRIARDTHDPNTLRELFAALGGDPFVIAETLGRPAIADRFLRSWYEWDGRFHDATRVRAEAALRACVGRDSLSSCEGNYSEHTWKLEAPAASGSSGREAPDETIIVDPAEWQALLKEWASAGVPPGNGSGGAQTGPAPAAGARRFAGIANPDPPAGGALALRESRDGFFVSELVASSATSLRVGTVTWPKVKFEIWWGRARTDVSSDLTPASRSYSVAHLQQDGCAVHQWTPTRHEVPDPVAGATAVWTGAEMLIWSYRGSGGRYSPSTDTWSPIAPDALATRSGYSVVWTGTEMILWGGSQSNGHMVGTGSRYNPASNSWTPTSTGPNTPIARSVHQAVWTGREMIVWGGATEGPIVTNSGGRYDPSSDTWLPTSEASGVPEGRAWFAAVWTGTRMIVWGGTTYSSNLYSGGVYDPLLDRWTPTPLSDAPSPRSSLAAVWTGTEMIVWGGIAQDGWYNQIGGRYNPTTNRWRSTSTLGAPSARVNHSLLWTGSKMIVWGGGPLDYTTSTNTGGRYDPVSDTWLSTSTGLNAPSPRSQHVAVWTGSEMIVWGGSRYIYPVGTESYNDGGRYDPASDSWVSVSMGTVPGARRNHSAIWTGSEMIVWGGLNRAEAAFASGGSYTPATDSWSPTSMGEDAPSRRAYHSAVWTGLDMIVWGGQEGYGWLNTGGRYNPMTNAWTPTSTQDQVPSERAFHSAVWTGTEMIIWGGIGESSLTNTGGRYNPSSNAWKPTSMGPNVPSARSQHAAVWTGERMLVWGGGGGNSGARYDPARDVWEPISMDPNLPPMTSAATAASVVWTGNEMIVWGGYAGYGPTRLGERYDPRTDRWAPTDSGPTSPSPRIGHAGIWTGREMIVWGGGKDFTEFADGGAYDPATDSWEATATGAGLPHARRYHTAVWTGTEMIVWGGRDFFGHFSTGGSYCSCEAATWYQDLDGDGHGNAAVTQSACVAPSGYVAGGDDCDDTNPAVYPGAAEVCNGLDDNCDGNVDELQGTTTCGVGACQRTIASCADGVPQLCLPGTPTPEVCNGVDDNCDGLIDNGVRVRRKGRFEVRVCETTDPPVLLKQR